MAKDCSELAMLVTEIARDLAQRPDLQTLDDVILEIQKDFPVMSPQSIIDNIVEATTQERRQRSETQRKWQAIRRVAKDIKRIQPAIEGIAQYLREGGLPETEGKPPRGESVLDSFRDLRDELQKKLRRSEPAVKDRLEKQIADLDEIMRTIQEGTYIPPGKPVETALSKELEDLKWERDQKRKEIRAAIDNMAPKSLWQRFNPFQFFHDLLAGGELSYVLRQGGGNVFGRIGETIEGAVLGQATIAPLSQLKTELETMFRALVSPEYRRQAFQDLMQRSATRFWVRNGLHLSPVGPNSVLAEREEFALSRLSYKIPILRDINEAGALFLNIVRVDLAEGMAKNLPIGADPTAAEARIIANMANQASGRGYEGGGPVGEGARLFFSFQYLSSRFKLLVGEPIWGNTHLEAAAARRIVAREYGRIFLGMATVYVLAALAGAEIEWDPRSSDFLKWKFGRHRIDPMLGFSQLIVFGARLISGQRKSAQTGKVTHLRGPKVRYGGKDAREVVWDFLQSKGAPLPSFALAMVSGKKMTGEPTSFGQEMWDLTHPITYEDVWHAMEEDGIGTDVAVSILTVFGMGLQTFQPEEWPKTHRRTP